MRTLTVFDNLSLDGYFTDAHGDMSWAHTQDAEWLDFTNSNAQGDSALAFGRVTYEQMAGFWPTPAALKMMPEVARKMNEAEKVVFSRQLKEPSWQNTRALNGDLAAEVRKLKKSKGPDVVLMGSGSIVSQLTAAGLVDEYQLAVHPLVLGQGRTLFETVKTPVRLELKQSRAFKNGNLVLWYQPA